MTLPTKQIPAFVSDMVATWNAQTGQVANFASGDILLAFWQSIATQFDFLQAQIRTVLNLCRASTSNGADLDSFYAQFAFYRLPASFATSPVTFSRALAGSAPVTVPIGTIVQTPGGAYQYQVVADTNQAAYNAAAGGYVLAAGQTSLTATVQAITAGAAYNVAAGAISQIASSVPGIDAVTNGTAVTNGGNAESDSAFRSRFILFLATLAKATRSAILAAALGVQQGLSVTLIENQRPDGTPQQGAFTTVIDDGSGSPPTATIAAVFAAIDATRAFTVQPYVTAPTLVTVSIVVTIRLATTIQSAAATNAVVQSTIATMINNLGPGSELYISAIESTALLVAGVVAVRSGTTIDGTAADLTPTPGQEVRTTVSRITVSNY